MNIRTMTTAATWLAAAAIAFAGCAAEETSDTPTGNAANNNNNNNGATNNNTAGNTGPSNTTTINSTVNSATTGSTTTGGTVTGTTGAGPVTTATVTGTAGGVTITNTATVNNTTGAGTTGGGATCDAPPAAGTDPMIDDFDDDDHTILANEGRLGYWYEYGDSDGTQMTAPLDGVPGTGGVLTASGSGFTEYVGFGVDLNNDNANSKPCPYDATIHTGIQFDITNDVAVTFQVALPGTAADSDHYSIAVPAATNGTFKAPFTMLAQGGWGDEVAWDPSQITQLQWQITDPTEAFNITLDNVSFY